jgi:thioredoxin reductase (NADPH)
LTDNRTGESRKTDIRHAFIFIGATPNTDWLPSEIAVDGKGFIRTGRDLEPEALDSDLWPMQRQPYLLETSLPGIFAAGDVRSGSTKRVASAVGEGSISVSFIHQVLSE